MATKAKKVRLIMLDDLPAFWKKGDKRRVKVEFADTLIQAGWAKMVIDDDAPPPTHEEKKK